MNLRSRITKAEKRLGPSDSLNPIRFVLYGIYSPSDDGPVYEGVCGGAVVGRQGYIKRNSDECEEDFMARLEGIYQAVQRDLPRGAA